MMTCKLTRNGIWINWLDLLELWFDKIVTTTTATVARRSRSSSSSKKCRIFMWKWFLWFSSHQLLQQLVVHPCSNYIAFGSIAILVVLVQTERRSERLVHNSICPLKGNTDYLVMQNTIFLPLSMWCPSTYLNVNKSEN